VATHAKHAPRRLTESASSSAPRTRKRKAHPRNTTPSKGFRIGGKHTRHQRRTRSPPRAKRHTQPRTNPNRARRARRNASSQRTGTPRCSTEATRPHLPHATTQQRSADALLARMTRSRKRTRHQTATRTQSNGGATGRTQRRAAKPTTVQTSGPRRTPPIKIGGPRAADALQTSARVRCPAGNHPILTLHIAAHGAAALRRAQDTTGELMSRGAQLARARTPPR